MKKLLLLSLTLFSALQSSPWDFVKNLEKEHTALNQLDVKNFMLSATLCLGGTTLYYAGKTYKTHRIINRPMQPNDGDIDPVALEIRTENRNRYVKKFLISTSLFGLSAFALYKTMKSQS